MADIQEKLESAQRLAKRTLEFVGEDKIQDNPAQRQTSNI